MLDLSAAHSVRMTAGAGLMWMPATTEPVHGENRDKAANPDPIGRNPLHDTLLVGYAVIPLPSSAAANAAHPLPPARPHVRRCSCG